MTKQSREELATRLGFLLLSAGCAIGLGNYALGGNILCKAFKNFPVPSGFI